MDAFSKPKPSSTSAKRVPSFDSSDSEAEVKAAAKKPKPVSKRKQVDSDDSDSDSDNLMSRLKAKSIGSKVSSDLGAGVVWEVEWQLNVSSVLVETQEVH